MGRQGLSYLQRLVSDFWKARMGREIVFTSLMQSFPSVDSVRPLKKKQFRGHAPSILSNQCCQDLKGTKQTSTASHLRSYILKGDRNLNAQEQREIPLLRWRGRARVIWKNSGGGYRRRKPWVESRMLSLARKLD